MGKLPTMAFVTKKPHGRFEIRETRRTAHGPRATTLVSFRALDDQVLEQVHERANGPVDITRLVAGARRAGAPIELGRGDQLARRLLAAMAAGDVPSPGLARTLADALAEAGASASGEMTGLAQWVGASEEERGQALADLLGLADALPAPPRRQSLDFPRLTAVSSG